MLSEGQRSQNTYFAAGVYALNIVRRILFGITQTFRFGKCVLEGYTVAEHSGHNEISSAVKYSLYLVKIVCGKALGYGTQHRNTSADAGFKKVVHIMLFRNVQQLGALPCDQLLVGCHNTFSGLKTGFCKFISRVESTHKLCHDPYVGVVEYYPEVLYEFFTVG